ncbi:MAG: hypothetical protein BRD45_01125 [Bacteroidetes bacterium QS_8_64_10]|nr:MAG: hypothetical protein BRD45_01125 [Bacteroidetes bacterium QS_8_64_10]
MSTLEAPRRPTTRREPSQDDRPSTPWTTRALVYYEQNRSTVIGALVALVLFIAGAVAYSYYQEQRAQEAEDMLAQIVSVYENGNYKQALQGTAQTTGLLALADNYGGSRSGNLARYYAADALYQTEQYDRALKYYKAFEKGDNLLGASAYAGMAAVHENKEQFERAGDLYKQAAGVLPGNQSAKYLMQAGRAYLDAGAGEKARTVFERVKQNYPDSQQADNVAMYLARLEAQSQ